MAIALISAVLLIILVLIAIRFGLNREHLSEDADTPLHKQQLNASGIYSIVRSTPRANIARAKPSAHEIRQYLDGINEDSNGHLLSGDDKNILITRWEQGIDENIRRIEDGDGKGIEFYYYDFIPHDCPVCQRFFTKGKFVTREEIFLHPAVIPPHHLGCSCQLIPHHGKENLRETTELGMLPFFKNQELPALPGWKTTLKITST